MEKPSGNVHLALNTTLGSISCFCSEHCRHKTFRLDLKVKKVLRAVDQRVWQQHPEDALSENQKEKIQALILCIEYTIENPSLTEMRDWRGVLVPNYY